MISTKTWVRAWAALRCVVALAISMAIIAQTERSLGIAAVRGWSQPATFINILSYFTVLSSMAAVLTLIAGVVIAWSGRRIDPPGFAVVLVAVTTYMIITGLVYNTLLRNQPPEVSGLIVSWASEIKHIIAPSFFLLDLSVAPLRRAVPWRTLWQVMVFPLCWLGYTLIRGVCVTNDHNGEAWWYPYPFLNPHVQPWGYGGVALYVIAITLIMMFVAAVVIGVGRWRVLHHGH